MKSNIAQTAKKQMAQRYIQKMRNIKQKRCYKCTNKTKELCVQSQ